MLFKLIILSLFTFFTFFTSNIYASSLDDFSEAAKSDKYKEKVMKDEEKKEKEKNEEKRSFCLLLNGEKEDDADMDSYLVHSESEEIKLVKSEKLVPINKDEEDYESDLFLGVSSIIPIKDDQYSWSFNLEALIVKSFGLYVDYTFFQKNSDLGGVISKINFFEIDFTKTLYYKNGALVLLDIGYYGMYDIDDLHFINIDFKLEKNFDPIRAQLKFGVGLDPNEDESIFKTKANISYTIKNHFEPFVGANYRLVREEYIGGVEAGIRFVF